MISVVGTSVTPSRKSASLDAMTTGKLAFAF
jgi:hypothetical protein